MPTEVIRRKSDYEAEWYSDNLASAPSLFAWCGGEVFYFVF